MAKQLSHTDNDPISIWIHLQAGLDKLLRIDNYDSTTVPNFESLYRIVYRACLRFSSQSAGLEKKLYLYKSLENFLKRHLQISVEKANGMSTETLLTFYISEWTRYSKGATMAADVFIYMDRISGLERALSNFHDTFTLHFVIWDEIFLKTLHDRLVRPLLSMSEEERLCTGIDRQQIKKMMDSIVALENVLNKIEGFELQHIRGLIDALEAIGPDGSANHSSAPDRNEHML